MAGLRIRKVLIQDGGNRPDILIAKVNVLREMKKNRFIRVPLLALALGKT
jgi:hypothetical protein